MAEWIFWIVFGLTLKGLALKTMFNVGSMAHPDFCGPPCAFIAAGKCINGATCGSGFWEGQLLCNVVYRVEQRQ